MRELRKEDRKMPLYIQEGKEQEALATSITS